MSEMNVWLHRTLPQLFGKSGTRKTLEIPIFPLKTVLFPGGILPLRVFEPRYMEMTKTCLRDDLPFGVCLLKEGKETGVTAVPEIVGCLTRITEWDMPQLGILNLVTLGLQRFSIEQQRTESSGLIMATVMTIPAESTQAVKSSLQVCSEVLAKIVAQVGADKFTAPLQFDDAAWVGYRLAEALPLKLAAKQSMLEMNDSIMRLEILKKFLIQQGLAQ
jgi:hypothetical protein